LSLSRLPLPALDALHLAAAASAQTPIVTTHTDLTRAARIFGVGVEVILG